MVARKSFDTSTRLRFVLFKVIIGGLICNYPVREFNYKYSCSTAFKPTIVHNWEGRQVFVGFGRDVYLIIRRVMTLAHEALKGFAQCSMHSACKTLQVLVILSWSMRLLSMNENVPIKIINSHAIALYLAVQMALKLTFTIFAQSKLGIHLNNSSLRNCLSLPKLLARRHYLMLQ